MKLTGIKRPELRRWLSEDAETSLELEPVPNKKGSAIDGWRLVVMWRGQAGYALESFRGGVRLFRDPGAGIRYVGRWLPEREALLVHTTPAEHRQSGERRRQKRVPHAK